MHPGLGEVAGDVEADPVAVFEAHDADSVDELVGDGSAAERESTADSGVDRLFEDGLDRPERCVDPASDRSTSEDRDTGAEEPMGTTASAVLAELEQAVAAEREGSTVEPDEFDAIDDGDVEDALAAAEAIDDADAESVPAEWQER